jgi:hypothetical protein
MVTELQFAAVAAYLLWCLVSSLAGVLGADQDDETISETSENNKITTAR